MIIACKISRAKSKVQSLPHFPETKFKFLQGSLGNLGNLRGYQGNFGDNFRKLGEFWGNLGKLRESWENLGKLGEFWENLAKIWGIFGILGNPKQILKIRKISGNAGECRGTAANSGERRGFLGREIFKNVRERG